MPIKGIYKCINKGNNNYKNYNKGGNSNQRSICRRLDKQKCIDKSNKDYNKPIQILLTFDLFILTIYHLLIVFLVVIRYCCCSLIQSSIFTNCSDISDYQKLSLPKVHRRQTCSRKILPVV